MSSDDGTTDPYRTATTAPKCEHPTVAAKYTFDADAAKGLTTYEIRARFPRFEGRCPDCGVSLIYYADYAHYVYGDW